MLEYWKRFQGTNPAAVSECTASHSVRLLTAAERAVVAPDFLDGNPTLPWFGFFLGNQMLEFYDDQRQLLRDLKIAGYRIIDISQLG